MTRPASRTPAHLRKPGRLGPARYPRRAADHARADVLDTLETRRGGLCLVDLCLATRAPARLLGGVLADLYRERRADWSERGGRMTWRLVA